MNGAERGKRAETRKMSRWHSTELREQNGWPPRLGQIGDMSRLREPSVAVTHYASTYTHVWCMGEACITHVCKYNVHIHEERVDFTSPLSFFTGGAGGKNHGVDTHGKTVTSTRNRTKQKIRCTTCTDHQDKHGYGTKNRSHAH